MQIVISRLVLPVRTRRIQCTAPRDLDRKKVSITQSHQLGFQTQEDSNHGQECHFRLWCRRFLLAMSGDQSLLPG